jgi:trans-aconitate methyltransferase
MKNESLKTRQVNEGKMNQLNVTSYLFLMITIYLPITIYSDNTFDHNWLGKDYDKNSSLQYNAATEILKNYPLEKDACILDIGCASGKITCDLAKSVPHGKILGIDKAPNMISFAKDNYGLLHSNLEFKELDAAQISFENEFDYVVSFSCLHWIYNLKNTITRIHKSLKPDGKLLILMELKSDYPLLNALENGLKAYDAEITWYLYTQNELEEWLTQAGFCNIEFNQFPMKEYFKNKTELEQWFAAIPFGYNLSAQNRKKMIEEIVDNYLQECPPQPNGIIQVTLPETIIKAIKKT